jgi:hypothetical protein
MNSYACENFMDSLDSGQTQHMTAMEFARAVGLSHLEFEDNDELSIASSSSSYKSILDPSIFEQLEQMNIEHDCFDYQKDEMKRDYWASSRMKPTIEQRGRFTIHRLIK